MAKDVAESGRMHYNVERSSTSIRLQSIANRTCALSHNPKGWPQEIIRARNMLAVGTEVTFRIEIGIDPCITTPCSTPSHVPSPRTTELQNTTQVENHRVRLM